MNRMSNNIKTKITAMLALLLFSQALQAKAENALHVTRLNVLSEKLEVGDIVFIQVTPYPFQKVANTTHSWVNHVGIVVDIADNMPVIAESTVPFSRNTAFHQFVARSANGRVAVARLHQTITQDEKQRILQASHKRLGIYYDTGFNLHSRGEFCSRFVREVMAESTGIKLGEIQTFQTLLDNNPQADLLFWRVWYFGRIPWQRELSRLRAYTKARSLKPYSMAKWSKARANPPLAT